jgi:hypothetical protein
MSELTFGTLTDYNLENYKNISFLELRCGENLNDSLNMTTLFTQLSKWSLKTSLSAQ